MVNSALSEAEAAGLIRTVQPVEHFIVNGLEESITKKLGIPVTVVSASDAVRTANKRVGNKLSYPYGTATLTQYTLATDRGNARATGLRGEISIVENKVEKAFAVKFLPVDMSYELEIVSNSYADILDAARRLLFARCLSGFVFCVQYGKHSFSIKAIPEETLSIPKREADASSVQEYRLMSNIKVIGHVSMPELMEQQIATSITITGQLTEIDPDTGDNRVIYTSNSSVPDSSVQQSPPSISAR